MKNRFFYRYWWLYYLLCFLLLGLLIYAILWEPECKTTYPSPTSPQQQTQTPPPSAVADPSTTTPPAVVDCNSEVNSGGYGRTITTHRLGSSSGKVVIWYEMYTVADRLTVFYDNKIVASTKDLVSGEGFLEFNYSATQGKPQECIVEVYGPDTQTEWEYQLNCPQ